MLNTWMLHYVKMLCLGFFSNPNTRLKVWSSEILKKKKKNKGILGLGPHFTGEDAERCQSHAQSPTEGHSGKEA